MELHGLQDQDLTFLSPSSLQLSPSPSHIWLTVFEVSVPQDLTIFLLNIVSLQTTLWRSNTQLVPGRA